MGITKLIDTAVLEDVSCTAVISEAQLIKCVLVTTGEVGPYYVATK